MQREAVESAGSCVITEEETAMEQSEKDDVKRKSS